MTKRSSINEPKPVNHELESNNPAAIAVSPEKNPHAIALGRRGGKIGGKARAQRLTASRRREIASKAAVARWQGPGRKGEKSKFRSTKGPDETRQAILKAAHEEFTKYGLAGGRVDRIAKRANVNKRMLYHYFNDKEALFREMLRRNLMQLASAEDATPQDLSEALVFWQRLIAGNPDWMRLSLWEALNYGSDQIIAAEERQGFWRAAVEEIRAEQAAGNITTDFDPAMLQLCLLALVAFPIALPQMAAVVTGLDPGSVEFQQGQETFLRTFGKLLRPVASKAD